MARIDANQIKDIFAQNLMAILDSKDMNPADLARLIGMEKQSVYAWLKLKTFPSANNLQEIVNALGVTLDDLLSSELGFAFKSSTKKAMTAFTYSITTITAPVYGRIAAGDPLEMFQVNDEEAYVIPSIFESHPHGFFLIISGDSMDKIMPNGTLAYVDPDSPVGNGEVGVVVVNGDDATVKRVFFAGDTIVLHPESNNPAHKDRSIDASNHDAPEVRMLGRVVWHYLEKDDRL